MELPRRLFDRIVAHARAERPLEACGVVAGAGGAPVGVYPIANVERSPVRYRFDEREQRRVFREIEDRGWDLLAFFHSHPDSPAEPSSTDRMQAHRPDPLTGEPVAVYPSTRYLILSLAGEPELRCFRFARGRAVEEEVRIS
ncbi:MAG TPA: M67 family metallopeptidase [Actinomycetota bacterium]|nr:M67 family metallopeptidase [Actinomycetota bacterium]